MGVQAAISDAVSPPLLTPVTKGRRRHQRRFARKGTGRSKTSVRICRWSKYAFAEKSNWSTTGLQS